MANFAVVYDACRFYPAPLRDLMVRLAQTRRFRARWTERIHGEWTEALLRARPELDRQRLERTVRLIDQAVPDCLVAGYEHLIDELDHVRIDEQVKARANATLAAMGLSMSDAVRVFPTRVAAEQRLPFALEAPNAETRAAMAEADTIARRHHARFTTAAELFDDLDRASRA